MAIEKIIDLKIESNAEEAVGSLRSQLRAAQADVAELSAKFGATSKEAVEAAKRAGELKDQIGDAKALTDAFNPDAKFKALSSSLSGVAGGFAAVQGGMALFGKESEDVEKTLLKVQAAMALSQGLQGLGEARDSFKQLKAVAVDAFKGIKAAIGSTGIGLLVVALGTIYAYWDDIKEAVSGVSEEQKKLNAASQKNVDLEAEKLKAIGNQDNILKLQGKSEKEILDIKIKQTDEAITANKINQQNQILNTQLAVEGAQRNYEMLKSYIDFVSIPTRFLYENAAKSINNIIDLLNKIPGVNIKGKLDEALGDKAADYIAKLGFDPEKVKAEGDKTVKASQETINKLLNDRAGYQLSKEAAEEKAGQAAIKKAEEEAAALKAIADKKLADDMKSAQDALNIVNALNESYETPAEKETREYNEKKAILEANNLSTELLTKKHLENLAGIVKTDADKKAIEDAKIAADKKTKDDAAAKEELDREKAIADGKKAIQEASFNVASNGISLLKTVFEKNKGIQKGLILAESAVGLARIVTNTQAANAADRLYAATMGPAGAGYLAAKIPLNYVGAAIGAAANIAATAKALSALGGGGAGSAPSGGGATGGGAAPQFNVVGNSGVNQLADVMNTQQQTPVKAYVVPSDVTTGQSLDRNIIRNASLG